MIKKFIKQVLPQGLIAKYGAYKKAQRQRNWGSLTNGNQVFCPICSSQFKAFKPYGLVQRSNAKCPSCGSLERHRLLYLYLTKTINIFNKNVKQVKLLHFAPEQIFYNKFESNAHINYTPCDLFPELYNYEGKVSLTQADITNIPFKDESFDFILCNHVLEHIPDDNLAMRELYRVMTKNGNGIFQVPIDYSRESTYEDWSITSPEAREKAFGQHDHVRWYGQDYKDRLATAGFTVHEVDYPASFSKEDLFKFGLIQSEKIYHVTK